MNRKSTQRQISIGIATLMTSQVVLAQFDDFPPPPPPMNAIGGEESNGFGSANSSANANGALGNKATKKNEVLDKKQKDKFNRANSEDITNENFPETIESFDFPNVEITDLIKAVGELTGKNFIIDPGVRGKITITAPSKITVAEAYRAFLSALAINGFTVVPYGSFLKVKSSRNAQRDSIETYSGSYYPNSDQMITKIIHLKHISAEQVNRDLRLLASKDGDIAFYSATNSIILSDYGSNIDRVMKILNQLDVPGFEEQLEVIPIKFAKAKDLADLVDKIVNKGQKSTGAMSTYNGSFSAGAPRLSRSSGTSAQQGASFFMAIPEDRTNSIIVVGNKSGILRIKKLISQLDFRINPQDNGGVYVYNVKYGKAKDIAQVLTGVTKDAAPKPTTAGVGSFLSPSGPSGQFQAPTEIFGGDVKITADESTNSLVIVASKQDYEVVTNLLGKLDVPRDQVFVEAVIMEMSANDTNNWGVGYYQYGSNGYGKVGFNGGVNINDILSPTSGTGAILSFGSGQSVTVTDPTTSKQVSIPSLVGLINFIKQVKKGNILSTPQITAMDNQEAELEVGDKVATSVTRTAGTNGSPDTYTPTLEDATIKLNIKPFISPASDSIRLEIKQNISQISNFVSSKKALDDNTQPLAKRNIKTTIVVNNGDTAILGGLIKDQETDSVTKVPLLGDIPILGWLFKSHSTSKDKVNMVVFLTPTIIRNPKDSRQVLTKRLDQRLEFIKNEGGRDPYGRKVDEILQRTSAAPADEVPAAEKTE